jgi:hypothetical protein
VCQTRRPSHSWDEYVLLGDDIVLADEKVTKEYMTVLDVLGVKVSEIKTCVSADTYEFTKRWIHFGEEVTGAPLGSLFQTVRFVKKSEWKDVVSTASIRHISPYGVMV